jgi:hypothetical protein
MDRFTFRLSRSLLVVTTLLAIFLSSVPVRAQKQSVYTPITLTTDKEVADTLTEKDIPTGDGGFARDYVVQLNAGDQVAIDLTSDNFDSMVTLMAADGSTVGQNDDGPDGSNNSLLFARIKETGTYIVRVRAFGETGSGAFKLKLSKLRITK